jgi:hypothetical protein
LTPFRATLLAPPPATAVAMVPGRAAAVPVAAVAMVPGWAAAVRKAKVEEVRAAAVPVAAAVISKKSRPEADRVPAEVTRMVLAVDGRLRAAAGQVRAEVTRRPPGEVSRKPPPVWVIGRLSQVLALAEFAVLVAAVFMSAEVVESASASLTEERQAGVHFRKAAVPRCLAASFLRRAELLAAADPERAELSVVAPARAELAAVGVAPAKAKAEAVGVALAAAKVKAAAVGVVAAKVRARARAAASRKRKCWASFNG